MEMLLQYLSPIVLIICLVVGYVLKHAITALPNNFIPAICALLGMVISVWANGNFTPETVCIGLLSGLASTGLHQVVTQILTKMSNKASEIVDSVDASDVANLAANVINKTSEKSSDSDDSNNNPTAVG